MNSSTDLVIYNSPDHGLLTIHVHWLDAVSVIAARWASHRTAHDKQHRQDMKNLWGEHYFITAEGEVKRGNNAP